MWPRSSPRPEPLLDTRSFRTTQQGYRHLLAWAGAFGRLQRAGVECTGSYGAALTRYLHSEGITVTEVNQPDKATRRRRGKTEEIDAAAAAQAVLSGRATASAKTSDGPVESIRMFKMAKTSAIKSRSQAINQLKAVLVAADPALREALTGLSNPKLIRTCSALEPAADTAPAAAARHTLRLLARRIQHLTEEINDLTSRITTAINAHAPKLLDRYGVGPDTAAALLTAAGDNPDRMGNEASFAALCGVSPVEASSDKTQRRRLNRGGDRQASGGYGDTAAFRLGLEERGLGYVVGISTTATAQPEAARPHNPPYRGRGPRPAPVYPEAAQTVKKLVIQAGKRAARPVQWREGSRPDSGRSGLKRMYSRFVALRVRPAGREIRKAADGPELPVCWLLAEWPATESEPVQFWLSNLPADAPLATLVRTAKLRWRIEHDYREMKQALGLAHFEGRTWRGWHHHVTLVSVAHAFCTLQRITRSPKETASA